MELDDRYKIINGNSLEILDTLEENSIDAIITDPPYELGFMGKSWDRSGIAYNVELWKKALRVLKCGGHLLAFGGSRTYHRIACAIEDAGFEIRDTIMWLYGSGFPKSMNIGLMLDKKNGVESTIVGEKGYTVPHYKDLYNIGIDATHERKPMLDKQANNEWNGWGTALKPAFEPIIVARKPVENSVLENVEKYRVGGINIDECRVGNAGGIKKVDIEPNSGSKNCGFGCNGKREQLDMGRFPANVILTYDETDEKEVCGGMPETSSGKNGIRKSDGFNNGIYSKNMGIKAGQNNGEYDDSGNACRYFYCAKASKKDRDSGLIMLEEHTTGELALF